MGMMDKMMEFMMRRMSKGGKGDMTDRMMEKFSADNTAEDKQKMMAEMIPRMTKGINIMEMMNMMGGGKGEAGMMGMMSKMMAGAFANMNGEEIGNMIHEVMPNMMESCFSKMDVEQRKGMLKICREILNEIESKYVTQ